jgi:4-hydroxybenzoate polyprenyltransferase
MEPSRPTAEARAVALAQIPGLAWRGAPAALLEAMRPKQWVKSVFVFAGVLFSGQLFDGAACLRACVCFASFCAASSAVYLVNDVCDRAQDVRHPDKRLRPIASGRLPVPFAVAAAFLLSACAVGSAWALSASTLGIVAFYLSQSVAYSLGLKRVFILDALVVAGGFVLRAAAGAAAVYAEISPWLVCCTFLLALFLALGKRRNELAILGSAAREHRRNLGSYSVPLLDHWLTALTGATLVCYALYTQSERTIENFHTASLVYTVPFVVFAMFRYQHLVVREEGGGDPGASLFRDRPMRLAILGWAGTAACIVYAR